MSQHSDLQHEYGDILQGYTAAWGDYLEEAQNDLDFYLLAQYTGQDSANAAKIGRQLYVMDKVKRQVDLLSGYEIRNRHILKIQPNGGNPQEDAACDDLTSVIMHTMNGRGYQCLSNAFKWGPLVQGSNLVEIWRDREGFLRFARKGFNQHLLDPGVTEPDLSDCQNLLTGQWVSDDRVQALLPTVENIDDIPRLSSPHAYWSYLGTPSIYGKEPKMRLYEEWWKRDSENVKMVASRNSGQEIPLSEFANKFADGDVRLARQLIAETLLPNGIPAMSVYTKEFPKIVLTVFVDGEVVWTGDNPMKMRNFPHIWVPGDYCAECGRSELKLQSFVRRLRDPQRARNRRINQAMDIIESQLQSYRVVRQKFIKNLKQTYESGQGVVIHLTDDAPNEMSLDQFVYQGKGADIPPGMFQFMEMIDKDMVETGGLNDEIFGSDDKDIPGILSKFRTGQAITGQQNLFESFRLAKWCLGMRLIEAIQANYPASRVEKIINRRVSPGFYSTDITQLDCVPTEGLLTDTQQQLFYSELKELRLAFPDMAQFITPSMLIGAYPGMFKSQIMEAIKQGEQASMASQQAMQQSQQRMNQLIEAESKLNLAKTAQSIASAESERASAGLDRAKAIAEIQGMDRDRLLKLLEVILKFEQKPQGATA